MGLEDFETVGTFAMVIDAETLTILDPGSDEPGFKGTYSVFRDTIEVTDDVDNVTARWSFDGKRLSFTDVTPENSPFEVVWESHPWEKVVKGAKTQIRPATRDFAREKPAVP